MAWSRSHRWQGERVDSKGQLSPDGQWLWDGRSWLPAGKATMAGAPFFGVGFMRMVPGFRSHNRWKMGVASIVYLGGAWLAGLTILSLIALAAGLGPPPSTTTIRPVAQVVASPTPVTESLPTPSPVAATHGSPSASPPPSPSPSPSPSPTRPPTPPPTVAPTAAPAPVVAPPAPPADPYAAATAAGASAVCADGSWSFSKTRSGTCSGHGGVHWWTGNLGPAGPGAH
jgi:hypothetical protein